MKRPRPPENIEQIRFECELAMRRYSRRELNAMSDYDRMVTTRLHAQVFKANAPGYVVDLLAYVEKLERALSC